MTGNVGALTVCTGSRFNSCHPTMSRHNKCDICKKPTAQGVEAMAMNVLEVPIGDLDISGVVTLRAEMHGRGYEDVCTECIIAALIEAFKEPSRIKRIVNIERLEQQARAAQVHFIASNPTVEHSP